MKRWTPEQEAAITARGGDLLVSAGAGAGKTSVLVERVMRRITQDDPPLDVDRLLVVTFTEAAAAEMRARIGARLGQLLEADPDNRHLQRQLALLPRADISTLHAFCLRLVRRHFHLIGADPSLRVLDEHEAGLLRQEVLDQLLERRFAADDPGPFLDLVARYGGRGGEGLGRIVLRLHEFAATQPDPEAWLEAALAPFAPSTPEEAEGHPVFRALRREGLLQAEQAIWRLEHAARLAGLPDGPAIYLETLQDDLDTFRRIRDALRDAPWDEVAAVLARSGFGRLPGVRGDSVDPLLRQQVQELRSQAREALDDLRNGALGRTLARHLEEIETLREPMRALVDLVRAFDEAYRQAKDALGAADFSDLERLCLRILRAGGDPGPYAEVIVDEYQDINPVQDAILEHVAGGGRRPRFMVGDVKQSIYRFRLADPTIFLQRRRRYSTAEDAPERRIDLPVNFRSRRSVLDAVNFVFRQLFPSGVSGIDYGPDEALRPGLDYPGPDPAVELHLLERDRDELRRAAEGARALGAAPETTGEHLRAEEREAVLIAREIRRLCGLDGGAPDRVWDPETQALRPVRPGDIAILLRSPRHRAHAFVETLAAFDVPARADLRTGYFDALEVATVLNLLRLIDNARQDIPLASVLHSPIVGLDAVDLARLRAAHPGGSFYDACLAAAQAAGAGSGAPGGTAAAAGAAEDTRAAGPGQAVAAFFQRLERWRTEARRGPLGDLLWRILEETGYFHYVGGMPGGPQRQANLERLIELARAFDGFSRQGLNRFLRFVDRLRAEERDLGAVTPPQAAGDAVQVMSIHQSKGLEFPIVFVADLGHEFNQQELNEPVLVHGDLGLGPRGVAPERGVQFDPAARQAVRRRLRAEAVAEEMRVLYVAMTRARERLILVGSASDLGQTARRWSVLAGHPEEVLPDAYLMEARSFLDLLGPALARHRHGAPLLQLAALPILPGHRGLFEDPSRWQVRVWPAAEAVKLVPPRRGAGGVGEEAWAAVAGGRVPELALSGEEEARARAVVDDLTRRLQWRLPRPELGARPAKASVTELARRSDPAHPEADSEEEPALSLAPAPVSAWRPRPPVFARDQEPDPAERGAAVHLVMQHLDLRGDLDERGVAAQIAALVDREVLNAEQAAGVSPAAVAAFWASELGQRILAAERVRREVPFTLRLDAAEVYPDLQAPGEWVLVQGVIDLVAWEPGGLLVVDFKTDRVAAGDVDARARLYAAQLRLYARAARTIFGLPVRAAYLAFLEVGRSVAVPLGPGE